MSIRVISLSGMAAILGIGVTMSALGQDRYIVGPGCYMTELGWKCPETRKISPRDWYIHGRNGNYGSYPTRRECNRALYGAYVVPSPWIGSCRPQY